MAVAFPSMRGSRNAHVALVVCALVTGVAPGAHADGAAPPTVGATLTDDEAIELVFSRLRRAEEESTRALERGARPSSSSSSSTSAPGDAILTERERRRVETELPALRALVAQERAYRSGAPLVEPVGLDAGNAECALLLLMIEAAKNDDRVRVRTVGERLPSGDALFRSRSGASADDQRLVRHALFTLARAYYQDGDDVRAASTLARLARVPEAPKKAASSTTSTTTAPTPRLALLPVVAKAGDDALTHLATTLTELLSRDLTRALDVEHVGPEVVRQKAAALAPALLGFVDGGALAPLASLVPSSHQLIVVVGRAAGAARVDAHVIDVARGLVTASVGLDTREDALIDDARSVVGRALQQSPLAVHLEVALLARGPSPEAADAVTLARARATTDEKKARALFVEGMRAAPTTAYLFDDLVARFPDVRPTVAVLPFASERGVADDGWKVVGVRAGVAHDLAALGLTVVPLRAVDDDLAARGAAPALFDDESARTVARAHTADLALVGALLTDGPRARLSVRAVHARSGQIAWSSVVEDHEGNLPRLLGALADIVRARLSLPKTRGAGALLVDTTTAPAFETWARALDHAPPVALRGLGAPTVRRVEEPGRPLSIAYVLGVAGAAIGAPTALACLLVAQPFAARAWQLHGLQQAVVDARAREGLRAERDQSALIANVALGGAVAGLLLTSAGVATVVVDGWLGSRTSIREVRDDDGGDGDSGEAGGENE
mgnify:CR=1 FL=1